MPWITEKLTQAGYEGVFIRKYYDMDCHVFLYKKIKEKESDLYYRRMIKERKKLEKLQMATNKVESKIEMENRSKLLKKSVTLRVGSTYAAVWTGDIMDGNVELLGRRYEFKIILSTDDGSKSAYLGIKIGYTAYDIFINSLVTTFWFHGDGMEVDEKFKIYRKVKRKSDGYIYN